MRRSLAVLLPFLLMPVVAAHGGGAQAHLSVSPIQLEPGQNRTLDVETGEAPPGQTGWVKGMVFIVYVQFFNESRDLRAELLLGDSQVVETWVLATDERHHVSGRIPADEGPYHVRFTNEAETQTQFMFYFDQDYMCTEKPVPLDDGWVLFGYDLKKGHQYRIGFPLVEGWAVDGIVATLERPTAHYPDDFHVAAHDVAQGPSWLNFTLKPSSDARHYVFVTVLEGSPRVPTMNQYVSLTPLLEDKAPAKSPAPVWGALVALAVLAVLARRRA